MTFNHRYAPFDNPAIRRALLSMVDQAEAMSAIAGSDRNNWRDDVGLFGTGSPLATDVGQDLRRTCRPDPQTFAEKYSSARLIASFGSFGMANQIWRVWVSTV